MTRFIEVLCEGSSDVPAVREVFARRFGLVENTDFKIIPHSGKGKLPDDLRAKPEVWRGDLLHQLPAKLRAYGKAESSSFRFSVVVVVDADKDHWQDLEESLSSVLAGIDRKPDRVLFSVAVEETESWFIAEPESVLAAYPQANVKRLRKIKADSVCDAWERLAEALGLDPTDCDGGDKVEWATLIAPHLSLEPASSPSLQRLLDRVQASIVVESESGTGVKSADHKGGGAGPKTSKRRRGRD